MAQGGAGYDIAKAGWLYRQTSVLHRWKKYWFTLDRQGDLRYFESQDDPRAEDRIVVRACVMQIKCGRECRSVDPPEAPGYSKDTMLELVMKEKDHMMLCAESVDDMRAWQISLDEARTLHFQSRHPGVVNTTTIVGAPGYPAYGYGPGYGPGYGRYASYGYNYPGQVLSPPGVPMHGVTQVVHTPAGTTTVVNGPPAQQIVYVEDYPRRRRRHFRGGILPMPIFFW